MNPQTQGTSSYSPSTCPPLKRRRGRPRRVESQGQVVNNEQGLVSAGAACPDMVDQMVHGVVEGSFDAGYLLRVKVGDEETELRGIVFRPGHFVPVTAANDVAPLVPMYRRREIQIPVPKQDGKPEPLKKSYSLVDLLDGEHGRMELEDSRKGTDVDGNEMSKENEACPESALCLGISSGTGTENLQQPQSECRAMNSDLNPNHVTSDTGSLSTEPPAITMSLDGTAPPENAAAPLRSPDEKISNGNEASSSGFTLALFESEGNHSTPNAATAMDMINTNADTGYAPLTALSVSLFERQNVPSVSTNRVLNSSIENPISPYPKD